jgi:hypothetical protein
MSELGLGYYWAIFKDDPRQKPQIVELIDVAGRAVMVMGRDNLLEPDQFEWLGTVEPPPL